jgi:hypothetical protein
MHHCPLCSLEFDGETCPPSCPMAGGCALIRCPKCGYEFVEDSAIVALVRRFIPAWRTHDSPAD